MDGGNRGVSIVVMCRIGMLAVRGLKHGGFHSISYFFNPLSQDFPSYHFCVFAKIAIRSIYPPISRYPCICEKCFQKFCRENSWGVGGLQQPPPVLRGKRWQQKYINFRSFHFLIFSFCHNNDYVPEILET